MDIKTVSLYRNLEQQAIKQSQQRAFSHDIAHKNNAAPEPATAPQDTKSNQSTSTKGLNYYA